MQPKQKAFFDLLNEYMSEFIPLNLDNSNLYEKMIAQVEKSLIHSVMKSVDYNQSKAAQVLGLHRATLRKKIKAFKLTCDAKD